MKSVNEIYVEEKRVRWKPKKKWLDVIYEEGWCKCWGCDRSSGSWVLGRPNPNSISVGKNEGKEEEKELWWVGNGELG